MRNRDDYAVTGAGYATDAVSADGDGGYLGELIAYYSEAGADYSAWSPNLHMHFGFFRLGMNPVRLERMLERMNHEVLMRLELEDGDHLLDAGCGVGSVARNAATWYARARVTGVNIVPWALDKAQKMTREAGLEARVGFVGGDFRSLPFAEASFDGTYAIESLCHAPGVSKVGVLRELYRVLKPHRRLVVADGFLKKSGPMPPALNRIYRSFCRCWALDTLATRDDFVEALIDSGFRDVQVEDISWRIVPSAAFIPLAALRWLWHKRQQQPQRVSQKQIGHAVAPFMLPAFALCPSWFGYYLITATK